MGKLSGVSQLLRGPGFGDHDILPVVMPSPADIATREAHASKLQSIPPVEDWRLSPAAGTILDESRGQVVRSNHFLVDTLHIPQRFFHYHVHLYPYDDRSGGFDSEDKAKKEDYRITVALMSEFREKHKDLLDVVNDQKVGFVYDNRNCVITTQELPLPERNKDDVACICDELYLRNSDGSQSRKRYQIILTYAATVVAPQNTRQAWATNTDSSVIRSLDLSLLSFARQQLKDDNPMWYLVGNKCFSENASKMYLEDAYVALRGYTVGLKNCLAGLTLVSDMTVSVFLQGGPLLSVISQFCGFESVEKFAKDAHRHGFDERNNAKINKALKNCKIRIDHLGHSRKFKELGPLASSQNSAFESDGVRYTVADYFAKMAQNNSIYREFMRGSELQYPFLPTVNVGSTKRPILIPMELVSVRNGQSLNRCTPDMTAKIVRHAAILPQERFQNLLENTTKGSHGPQSVITELRNDPVSACFGVSRFQSAPMNVAARLLPPPKLQYRDQVFSPNLDGEWNILTGRRAQFVDLPPSPRNGTYMYGILIVCRGGQPPRDWEAPTKDFKKDLERDASSAGLELYLGGRPLICSERFDDIEEKAASMQRGGVRILVVILGGDFYCSVKYTTDRMGLMTQCIKWKNIIKPPRGFHMNVMLKINTKMGGTNHTLASLLSPQEARAAPPTFQDPPASLGWVFDKPCMLVGIDTSHPEPGSNKDTVAAVVGSINGQASQYAAHISSQPARAEMVAALEDALYSLINTFKSKNQGRLPEHMIVYRDGVSDGQFEEVMAKEFPCVRNALELHGSLDCKITFLVCQKRHHTRLVYEDSPGNYVNCCPGLCVDGTGKEKSIASAVYNEFYLNSHTAIQGTAKCCKYSLLHDEIGMKIAELELLTYWSCYLYTRCNRSVSLATPCYYAHWASRRAKHLFNAGANERDLADISKLWSEEGRDSTMFFV